MKTTEDSLNNNFNNGQKPDEGSTIKIQRFRGDELKKIRKKIKKIPQTPPKKSLWKDLIDPILKFTAVAGFCGFAVFIAISWPGLASQLKWLYYTEYLNEKMPEKKTQTTSYLPTPTPPPLNIPSYIPEIKSEEGNYLKIPKIDVNVPIIWDVEEEQILEKLKDGVVHYRGTSHPGEGGNIFIAGHSSNYFWIKSDYNNIFALLDKLVNGDRIEIKKGSKSYFYDVVDNKVVSPKEVEYLNQTNKETLTLMTCWPPGTSLNRRIVQAQFVYSSN